MKFHPDKCKVVTIKHRPPLAMLPFVAYHYHVADNIRSYIQIVHVNKALI